MEQRCLGSLGQLEELLRENRAKTLFLVCDPALALLPAAAWFDTLEARAGIRVARFSDFEPNPVYGSVVRGIEAFRAADTPWIMAVGGGSAMDMAKCIKLWCRNDLTESALRQSAVPNDVRLIAMPTTAGTGSEATRFAVIYDGGEKQSVTHESIIPSVVVFDPGVLKTLPDYQRKATMLDALCHAVESCWSVNSTEESGAYALEAVRMILDSMPAYLANEEAGNAAMLRAAHLAGKAINITQTTAGHAMCYKLTGLYGLAHGHAAALCDKALFPWLAGHTDRCVDPRGEDHLRRALRRLAADMGRETPEEAAVRFGQLTDSLALPVPPRKPEDIPMLAASVNPERLRNFPARLERTDIEALYREILCENHDVGRVDVS